MLVYVFTGHIQLTTSNSIYSNGKATIAVDPNIKWKASK